MNRETVLNILRSRQTETTAFGVKHLFLFGSVARGDTHSGSDVDLMVEFSRPVSYFGLIDLEQYLHKVLECEVDLGTVRSLKPILKDQVEKEMILVY